MGSWVAEPSRGRESAFRDCCGRWDSQAKWERWRDKGSHQRKHRDIQRGRENSLEADRARGKKKVRGDLDGVLGREPRVSFASHGPPGRRARR